MNAKKGNMPSKLAILKEEFVNYHGDLVNNIKKSNTKLHYFLIYVFNTNLKVNIADATEKRC